MKLILVAGIVLLLVCINLGGGFYIQVTKKPLTLWQREGDATSVLNVS